MPSTDPAERSDISAFLDGELQAIEARRVINAMVSDQARQADFRTYCLIGDALRGSGHWAGVCRLRLKGLGPTGRGANRLGSQHGPQADSWLDHRHGRLGCCGGSGCRGGLAGH